MGSQWWIKMVVLIVVAMILAPSVYDLIVNFGASTVDLATKSGPQQSYPIANFFTRACVFLTLIILLFTPGKIESPIHYFAKKFSDKIYIFFNFNTLQQNEQAWFGERTPLLNAALLELLFLSIVVSIYYYLIRKMFVIDSSYLALLFFLFFVYIIIGLNTYIVRTLSISDDALITWSAWRSVGDTAWYLNHKIIIIVWMAIGMILLITGWDAISVSMAETVAGWNLPFVNWFASPVSTGGAVSLPTS